MKALKLILYTRKGCCLCEGLEQRLRKLHFKDLQPPMELSVIDIDDKEVTLSVRHRYDLKVPSLVLELGEVN